MDPKPIPGGAILKVDASKTANAEIGVPSKTLLPQPMWHSRGYLPHFESPEAIQHVTYHLADSLPQVILRQLEAELKALPVEKRKIARWKRLEAWIDAGHGSCMLREPTIAEIAQDSLLIFDARRYRLLAWVVMPNHVHALFEPIEGWTAAKIVAGWKRFTATKISAILVAQTDLQTSDSAKSAVTGNANLRIGAFSFGRSSTPVWHREYWDRYIRDERYFNRTIEYIHLNPVKAGLAITAESWPWSSANPNCQRTRIST